MKAGRILIVEDERIIAMDLQLQLQALGYTVCAVVATGKLAIDKAKEERPDLVLMDIHLEGAMDGVDAATEIYLALKTPIVFLSAYAEDATLQRAESALPYGYLVKPVSPRELHATLQMAMSRSHIQQDADALLGRFSKAMQAARLEIWEWRADIDHLNIYSLNGLDMLPRNQVISEPIRNFLEKIDRRDLPAVMQAMEQTRQEGGSFTVSFRLQDGGADGERWLEAHGKRFDELHQNCRIIGVLQDITTRRQTEERLRQAVTVFDSTAEGIAILDAERKVVSINPAFTEQTGYSEAEALGWASIDSLYLKPHSAGLIEQLQNGERKLWQGNVSYLHHRGHSISIWESLSAVPGHNGKITHFVLVFSDISSVLAAQEQLDFLAKHDPLTNLSNRRMLFDRLEYELAQATRHRKMVAVLLIDLDHFKHVNDSLGHAAGDHLLTIIAARLQACVRASDTVARLGGDEFCIVLGDVRAPSQIDQTAQKLLDKLSEPVQLEQMTCYVSGSIGIALAPTDGAAVSELLRNADQAMYGAKQAGRNRCCFYAPAMQKAAEIRLQISSGLHQALEHGALRLLFQPIVDLADGKVVKAEALLRWRHEQTGEISPSVFIPIAEECGMIGPISEWVFDEALRQLSRWLSSLDRAPQVSINVSALHFRDEQNHTRWIHKAREAGMPTNTLVLEITERLLLDADPKVRQALDLYRSAGFMIALDDFGTGYSALSYLKQYNLDYLKIDQSFIRQLDVDARDQALCEAIIALAGKLDLQVIAEGVETKRQANFLLEAGCRLGQGFLYAPPMEADAFIELFCKTNAAYHPSG
ncbi:EAL domain-containing protein [Chromobacterium sp. IIBBL 290-4]|uniref:two-component system response regulator n=1 Tax=Chromobacterium sp. IIBBL 290-4 TaxID=2953890 RepID=UPI0020B84645|nr:EAL domain-containing protein [Chromobacterium sp. IIBBL 290-4]UTH72814.1 EAL domain-containing protein [Chromobacterium sp. IIBBL 290-4]